MSHKIACRIGVDKLNLCKVYCALCNQHTVRGKILEGEKFGELMALKPLARKNLANLLEVY